MSGHANCFGTEVTECGKRACLPKSRETSQRTSDKKFFKRFRPPIYARLVRSKMLIQGKPGLARQLPPEPQTTGIPLSLVPRRGVAVEAPRGRQIPITIRPTTTPHFHVENQN